MNVSEQIIQVIDNLAQKFGIVIDWTDENIVPIFQQLADKYIRKIKMKAEKNLEERKHG